MGKLRLNANKGGERPLGLGDLLSSFPSLFPLGTAIFKEFQVAELCKI